MGHYSLRCSLLRCSLMMGVHRHHYRAVSDGLMTWLKGRGSSSQAQGPGDPAPSFDLAFLGDRRRRPLARGLHEFQRHAIALADRQILLAILVAETQRGWQRPHALRIVL